MNGASPMSLHNDQMLVTKIKNNPTMKNQMQEDKMVSELMRERRKVIAPYPFSPYEVGQLVEVSDSGTRWHMTTTNNFDAFCEDWIPQTNWVTIETIDQYPHLFQKLEWWMDRELSELPGYLKYQQNGHVRKVKQYHMRLETVEFEGGRTRKLKKEWAPCTSQQYHSFINQSK